MARTRLDSGAPTSAAPPGRRGSPRRWPWLLAILFLAASAIVAVEVLASYQSAYADRIYPGVVLADGLSLGSLTRQEVTQALAEQNRDQLARQLRLRYAEREWLIAAAALGTHVAGDGVWDTAYRVGREGDLVQRLTDQLDARRFGRVVDVPVLAVDEAQTAGYVAQLGAEIDRPLVNARLVLDPDLTVRVTPSQVARRLDTAAARQALRQALASSETDAVELPVIETPPAMTEASLETTRAAIATMLSSPVTLRFQDRAWTLSRAEIADLLVIRYDALPGEAAEVVTVDETGLAKLARQVAGEIDQAPAKPRLQLDAGQLSVIREGRVGHELDTTATVGAIKSAIAGDDRAVSLPVRVTVPPGMSEDRLAIRELVAEAATSYAGGLAERRHNVELAAAKLNGTVVGPGEIFSFNEELGPMTLDAGFKWGFGITRVQGEMVTVPSVAGGICQVATTLFQSIFWSGYQIEQRKGHSYWIERYGQPPTGMKGLDATVDQLYDKNGRLYATVDLKFKNTTPHPILIEAKTDGSRLTFSLYSTKPNWTVTVTPPRIDDVVKADPTVVRQADPSLAPGQQLWIEAAQDGFRSTIVRTVAESGQQPRVYRLATIYQPSRNVVLVGPTGGR